MIQNRDYYKKELKLSHMKMTDGNIIFVPFDNNVE